MIPGEQPPLVVVQQAVKTSTIGSEQIAAIKGVSFQVHAGEFVALVGPSGASKSTLLNMMSGVDTLSSSSVQMGDEPTGNFDSQSAQVVFDLFAALAAEGKTIVMVTQDATLASHIPRHIELDESRLVRESVNTRVE